MGLPYIIAVNGTDLYCDEQDIEDVLIGAQEICDMDGSGNTEPVEVLPDNFFFGHDGPRNQKVSAVLAVNYLCPDAVASKIPILWFNPRANYKLDPELWQGPKKFLVLQDYKTEPLQVEYMEGKKAWEILVLHPEWPYKE